MQKRTTSRERSPGVLVICGSAETRDGLAAYLGGAGVSCESRRDANPLAELPHDARAIVVFPDDFPGHQIGTYLALVGTRRPDLAFVIVTRNASVYTALRTTSGRSLNATVLPKPAFGWSILDAIRAALDPPLPAA